MRSSHSCTATGDGVNLCGNGGTLQHLSQILGRWYEDSYASCTAAHRPIAKLKKHENYCRRKREEGPTTRRRSCDACVRSKIRCDGDPEGCKPCLKKGVSCIYAAGIDKTVRRRAASAKESTPKKHAFSQKLLLGAASSSTKSTGNDIFHNKDTVSSLPWRSDGIGYPFYILRWHHAHQADTRSSMTSDLIGEMLRFSSFTQSVPLYIQLSTTGFDSASFATSAVDLGHAFSARSGHPGSLLALRILKSFPSMMVRRETLPPFIHNQGYESDFEFAPFPTLLENAMSIISLLYGRGENCKKTKVATWEAIRLEVKKIIEMVSLPLQRYT